MRSAGLLLALGCSFTSDVLAQSVTATFACPAPPTETCFFAVFGANFRSVTFELRGGETTQRPDVMVGKDRYCYKVGGPVASDCPKVLVTDQVNGLQSIK